MKKLNFIVLLLSLTNMFAVNYSLTNPVSSNNFSLLNPNKLDMSHSMSFSTSFGNDNTALYQSVYTNHLKYNFSPKLKFEIDLNFVNNGSAMFDSKFDIEGNNDNKSMVIPGFSLEYKPFENTSIRIQYNGTQPLQNWIHRDKNW
ncbi:MAG: hypothetical protein U9N34_07515 [Candidatus Cloacimonadota bacterium]|nr:hypothetical protein [Candidatus Cloacimonadota bacterium]